MSKRENTWQRSQMYLHCQHENEMPKNKKPNKKCIPHWHAKCRITSAEAAISHIPAREQASREDLSKEKFKEKFKFSFKKFK